MAKKRRIARVRVHDLQRMQGEIAGVRENVRKTRKAVKRLKREMQWLREAIERLDADAVEQYSEEVRAAIDSQSVVFSEVVSELRNEIARLR